MISAFPSGPHGRHRLTLIITAVAAVSLLTGGCSSSSRTSGDTGGTRASETHSSDSARETAERRLEQIGPQLGAVLTDYRAGKKSQAYDLAKSVSVNLYEGTAEGIVSSIDPAVERQIDTLLAATLPAAIKNGDPASQVATLVHQAQTLAASGLSAIHNAEH